MYRAIALPHGETRDGKRQQYVIVVTAETPFIIFIIVTKDHG